MAIKITSEVEHSSGISLLNAVISTKSAYKIWKTGNVYYVDFVKFFYLDENKYASNTIIIQENSRLEITLEDLNNITEVVYNNIKSEYLGASFVDM